VVIEHFKTFVNEAIEDGLCYVIVVVLNPNGDHASNLDNEKSIPQLTFN